MAKWNEGAVTDIPARPRFHREATPIWLATACTLLGVRTPSLSKPFRYADLGCGTGLHAAIVAATCPRAEVWGFDFNPANIDIARDLAQRAGLTNIHFVEVSFCEIGALDLPEFDIMIAEAVLSVVSPEDQGHIRALIGRRLRPGGLAYLGYASDTAWASFVPMQAVLRGVYESGDEASDFALNQGFSWLDRMKAGGARYFHRNPLLERRLERLRQLPAADVAHDYLGREWHPLMFADVADAMAEAKCEFVGRAALHENIAAEAVPAAMVPLLDEAPTIRIRETMQDVAAATEYRRDIYRRGLSFLPVSEHRTQLAAIAVSATQPGVPTAAAWPGRTEPDPAIYQPLAEALRAGPLTVAQAHALAVVEEGSVEAAADALAMLIAAGHAHPVMPALAAREAAASVAALNDAIIDAITRGEELGYLVSPVLGSAIETNPLEALTVGALRVGGHADDPRELTESVGLAMRRGGRSVVRDGVAVEDPIEAAAILRTAIEEILELRVPLLRRLGLMER